jgi:hypothetical protein
MSISMSDPHRSYSTIATTRIVECKENALVFRDITSE